MHQMVSMAGEAKTDDKETEKADESGKGMTFSS